MVAIVILIFAAFILTGIGGLVYLFMRIQRFWPEDMPRKKKRLLSFIPIAALLVYVVLDFVNGVIVAVNVFAIWVMVDCVGWLIRKIRKKPMQFYWMGVCAIVVAVAYLGYGFYTAHHVVATRYTLTTDKILPSGNLRIVQIADAHLGATFDGDGFAKHVKQMEKEKPDMLVITGDFVDDSSNRADLEKACEALGKMKTTYGVYYVYGNHDKGFYNRRDFKDKDMREVMAQNNITILEDEKVTLGGCVDLYGRKDRASKRRKKMSTLIAEGEKEHYQVILDHQPHDYDAQEKAGVDLVLGGHTHGGQMFPIGITGELSGANDMTYGMRKRGRTTFIVTSGISDWAIDYKTGGAISEYVVIDIKQK